MKNKQMAIIVMFLFLSFSISIIYSDSQLIQTSSFPKIVNNYKNSLKISAIIDNITGNCTEGINSLYVYEPTTINSFEDDDNATFMVPANYSPSTFEYNLSLARISVSVTAMTEPFKVVGVANDTSNATFGVVNDNVTKLAQEFTIEETSQVKGFSIYLNYTTWASLLSFAYLDIYRVNDMEGEKMNLFNIMEFMPDTGLGVWSARWFNFSYNNLLPSGTYFAVFHVSGGALIPPRNDSWQIQNFSNPVYNNGSSLFKNSSGWFNITDDATADFILKIEVAKYVDPQEVNLTCYVNDHKLDLIHYEEQNPGFLRFPWVSVADYYLPSFPQHDANFTLTVNRTLGYGSVSLKTRYIKFLNVTGNYTLSFNRRRWTVNYTSINSTSTMVPVFIFPLDWTVNKFYDRYNREVIEYGIMNSEIYSRTYHGIYYPEGGDGYTTFYYRADFSSPNYVGSITPQIFTGNEFITQYSFYKDSLIRLQAKIQDSDSNAAWGGNCSFYLYDSSSNIVFFDNTTVINGIANSENFSTSNLQKGSFTIVTIWTNGTEMGYSSFSLTIQNKPVYFFPPPTQEPILLYILSTAFVVLGAVVGGLITKRKLQERNWEKSLLHLFIMTKDGRSLYDYSFGIEEQDPTLISGMLTAMSSFVKETMGSKKQLRTIDQQDKKVILGHGQYCTVAVFAEKDLAIIHNKTEEFVNEFEKMYQFKIEKWDGATSAFKGTNKIIERIYPVSIQEKVIRGVGRELSMLKEQILSASDPQEIMKLIQQTTSITERYQDIIRDHFNKEYGEILKIANDKISGHY
ncbi:MAG: hypothetical protein ACTSRG_01795 [Candidatus Helarchaeota archaeon]